LERKIIKKSAKKNTDERQNASIQLINALASGYLLHKDTIFESTITPQKQQPK